jgi:uncharacterized protein
MNIPEEYIRNLYRALLVLLIVLSLAILSHTFRGPDYHGGIGKGEGERTIVLTGHGEIQAVPDIANVYFTIRKEGKTVKAAQESVAGVEKPVLEFLKSKNIADKDIQTTNSSFNPRYQYVSDQGVPCNEYGRSLTPCKNTITGYEAYESITVKVRNADNVGEIMQGLGGLNVTELSGPNFSIDNEDTLKAQARKKAIDDAQSKAKALADDLGIRLGKISNFSESGGYYPMYYAKDAMAVGSAAAVAPEAATIPKGENTISSDVTITYEIR